MTPDQNPQGGSPGRPVCTAAGRYGILESYRSAVLERARAASKLTLPTLIPPVASTQQTRLPTPWQSVGARGVNNICAKLLLSLFPPNSPFFRLMLDDSVVERVSSDPQFKTEIEKALAKYEREVQNEVETSMVRGSAFEALKHLVVGGNVLVHILADNGMRVFALHNYVVKRSGDGTVLEIILRERVSLMELPEAAQKLVAGDTATAPDNGTSSQERSGPKSGEDTHELYTWIKRTKKNWTVHQEIGDAGIIPGTQGTYPLDKPAWLALRWSRVDGEDYGRGHVEEYQGDLQSLEGLTRAIVEGSAAMAKLLILVKPNGTTRMKDVSDAPSGAVREGNSEDVTTVQMEKGIDLKVTAETAKQIEDRLSYAFLLNSAVQRDAERVTAEEIRYVASELDSTMGGLYSVLSHEFQLPYVCRIINQLERKRKLPVLPKGMVKPTIITGIEALGRGNDLDKLDRFLEGLGEVLGPQVVAQYVIVSNYMERRATALGIDTDGLIKPQAQVDQEQQQQQQQAMAQNVAPHMVKGAADIAKAHVATQAQQQQPPAAGSTGASPSSPGQ